MAPKRQFISTDGRILGVDYGEVRIGLAVSDPTGTIATPIEALEADIQQDASNVAEQAVISGASSIVVGLPLSLDGSTGPAARKVQAFCTALRKVTDLSVIAWDERMSSVEAQSRLRDAGFSPTKARGKERGKIDSAAAAIILESYLRSRS